MLTQVLAQNGCLIKRNKKVTVMIVMMMIMKRVRKEKKMIMNVIRPD